MSKELAVVAPEGADIVDAQLAALVADDLGAGMGDMGRDDFALPFLKILQALSPELKKSDPKFIVGAEAGDLVNSITGQLVKGDQGAFFIRVYADKKFMEWKPRDIGGGLVRISVTREEAEEHRTSLVGAEFDPKKDTEIVETAQIYGLMQTEDAGWRPVVLSLTKSKLRFWRLFNSLADEQTVVKWGLGTSSRTLPVFAVVYLITTRLEKKSQGDFYVPVAAPYGLVPADVYADAKAFRAVCAAGRVKVQLTRDEEPDAETVDSVV